MDVLDSWMQNEARPREVWLDLIAHYGAMLRGLVRSAGVEELVDSADEVGG
jgi:hypothetical protein